MFLNKRNDININSKHKLFFGGTPLHVAVKLRNYKKVKVLLNKGAKINIEDAKYRKPIDYAKLGDNRMKNLLSPQRVKNNFKLLSLLYGKKGFSPSLASHFAYKGLSKNRKRIVNKFRNKSS